MDELKFDSHTEVCVKCVRNVFNHRSKQMSTFLEAYGNRLKFNFENSFKLMFWPFNSAHNTPGMKAAFSPVFPFTFLAGLVATLFNATIGLITSAISVFIEAEGRIDSLFTHSLKEASNRGQATRAVKEMRETINDAYDSMYQADKAFHEIDIERVANQFDKFIN